MERKLHIASVVQNLTPAGIPEGEPEVTESDVSASFVTEDGVFTLSFREKTEGGVVSTHVTVGEDVTVSKRGALSYDMRFFSGTDRGLYRVGPYAFDYEISTLAVKNGMENGVGTLEIFYLLKIGGADKKVRFTMTGEG